VREEYVRRMATEEEIERILSEPRIIEGVRDSMRRDLKFEGTATLRTSRVERPDPTPRIGRRPGGRTNRRRSTIGTSDRSLEE
jgi:hypothetical protein